MVLERTASEVIIRLPANINWENLDLMIRFIKYKQNVSKSKATQDEFEQLARLLSIILRLVMRLIAIKKPGFRFAT